MSRFLAFIALAIAVSLASPAASQTSISQLPAAGTFNGSEIGVVVQTNGGVASTRSVAVGTALQKNTGTSGSTLCLLSTTCTWSGLQTFSGGVALPSLTAHGVLLGEGVSGVAATATLTSGQLLIGQGISADPSPQTLSGDASLAASGALTVNSVLGGKAPMIHAATNTALGALASTAAPVVVRDGYASAGDGPAVTYVASASACASADGGAQVTAADGKCWVASFTNLKVDERVWGAFPDNGATDDGPGLRAACAWAAAKGGVVSIPVGNSVVKTLDGSGLAGIVMGTGSNTANPGCPLEGQHASDYPDTVATDSPQISLGSGLNRPLILIQQGTSSPTFTDITLNGNRGAQTGCTAPGAGVNYCPGNKLYAVVVADNGGASVDSSVRLVRTVVFGGYNGDFYLGSGRGDFWVDHSWFQYSGQTTSDFAVFLNGYDTTWWNVQVGSNAGTGVIVAEGSQYQFTNGAVFLNNTGIEVNGNKVNYLNVHGVNFQDQSCGAIKIDNSAPYSSSQAGGHTWSNVTFDGNSQSGNGVCSDISVTGSGSRATSVAENFVNPTFVGNESVGGNLPLYNIASSGSALIKVANPQFKPVQTTAGGTTQAGAANTAGFVQVPGSVMLSNADTEYAWTPSLFASTSGAGTPASYTYDLGAWSPSNNEIILHGSIQTSSLAGLSGSMVVGGLPAFSSSTSNDFAVCQVANAIGWTDGAGGYTSLYGLIAPGSNQMFIYKAGSGKSAAQTPASEWANASQIFFTCVYHQ